jgi:hypothetical protein
MTNVNESIILQRRAGTPTDPYIFKSEQRKINNGIVILSEIPNYFNKVQVTGGTDLTWIETSTSVPSSKNAYTVDYLSGTGIVSFHPSREGLTVTLNYYGTGSSLISASRVFLDKDINGNITNTLQELVEKFDTAALQTGRSSIVIAPADANELSKKQADIILDGHADQVKINAAISVLCNNPLGAFGDWKRTALYFLEGKIKINAPILVADCLTIRGSGCNTIFYLEDGSNCDLFSQDGYDTNTVIYKLNFSDFLIDGNYVNNTSNQSTGIKVIPQEFVFDKLWVTNCYRGMHLYGTGNYGGFISKCMIQNNYNYGLGVGGDTVVTQCGIGGNGSDPAAMWDYGAAGVFLAGWNTQFSACHFASNRTDIFSNWTAYNQIQCCVFEAGLGRNIDFQGRAWGWTIIGNRFGGRRASQSDGSMAAIEMRFIDPSEGAHGNIINSNSFTIYEGGDVGYSHCIIETANCYDNLISNNIFKGGYSESVPVLVNSNSALVSNIH